MKEREEGASQPMPMLKGKLGQATEKWLRQTMTDIARQSHSGKAQERGLARLPTMDENLFARSFGLRTLAPPIIPPRASELVQSASAFAPGSGEAQDAISLAGQTEELLRGKKKFSKEAIAALTLSIASVILPGKMGKASRQDIIDYAEKEIKETLSSTQADKFVFGFAEAAHRIPQKTWDEIEEFEMKELRPGLRGRLQRSTKIGVADNYYEDPHLMSLNKPEHRVILSTRPETWHTDPAKKAFSTLAHETGHSVSFKGLEKLEWKPSRLHTKEMYLKKKIEKIKAIHVPEKKALPGRRKFLTGRQQEDLHKIGNIEYRLSHQEKLANRFAENLRDVPVSFPEAEIEKNFAIAFEQSMDEALTRGAKTINRELMEEYKKLIRKK